MPRADRRTDGHLPLSHIGVNQYEAGDVDARDQQQQANRSRQHRDGGSERTHHRVLQRASDPSEPSAAGRGPGARILRIEGDARGGVRLPLRQTLTKSMVPAFIDA